MRQQKEEADFCKQNKIIIFGFKILLHYDSKYAIDIANFFRFNRPVIDFFCAEVVNFGKI